MQGWDLKGPLASHSRRVSLDTLAPSAPCFSSFASKKRYLIVFSCSPTPSAEVVNRNFIFCIQHKKDTLRCPLRWMQGWDLKGPLASHSRRVSLDTLAPSASCFGSFASKKRYLIVFSCSPTPSAEVVNRNFIFCIQHKKDTLRCPLRWMQGWDLNLTTSGL